MALTTLDVQVLEDQRLYTDGAVFIFPFTVLSTYEKRWRRYCENNDISYTTLYGLRHTFISVAKQLPEGMVKQIVGHSRNMDTFGVYGHALSGEMQETAERIEDLFGAIIKN